MVGRKRLQCAVLSCVSVSVLCDLTRLVSCDRWDIVQQTHETIICFIRCTCDRTMAVCRRVFVSVRISASWQAYHVVSGVSLNALTDIAVKLLLHPFNELYIYVYIWHLDQWNYARSKLLLLLQFLLLLCQRITPKNFLCELFQQKCGPCRRRVQFV